VLFVLQAALFDFPSPSGCFHILPPLRLDTLFLRQLRLHYLPVRFGLPLLFGFSLPGLLGEFGVALLTGLTLLLEFLVRCYC
jgi:hypothetical protein